MKSNSGQALPLTVVAGRIGPSRGQTCDGSRAEGAGSTAVPTGRTARLPKAKSIAQDAILVYERRISRQVCQQKHASKSREAEAS